MTIIKHKAVVAFHFVKDDDASCLSKFVGTPIGRLVAGPASRGSIL